MIKNSKKTGHPDTPGYNDRTDDAMAKLP